MISYRNALGVAVASIGMVLSGCAATTPQRSSQALLPEIDVVQVKENSDEALRLAQEAKLDVEMVNTKLTAMDNKLVLLSEEVASVSIAKIEELENRNSLLIEAMKDLQAQIEDLKILPRARSSPGGAKPAGPATFSVTTPEYASYELALRTYNARNFAKARDLFGEVIQQYPNGKYTDNCEYWIGECYYAIGDYGQAIAAFQRVLTFANSSKADDAQFKLGKAYLAMGQTGPAKLEWKKLLAKFSNSEYSVRARKYLDEME